LRSDVDLMNCGTEVLPYVPLFAVNYFFGAAKSIDPAKTLERQLAFLDRFPSFPFDDSAAARYGPIRAHLERGGQKIGANDLFIAAIALANNLILVTHNINEFARVPGLTIEDWQIEV